MATLTAFKFDSPDGAEKMSDLLQDLQRMQYIAINDGAIVSWPQGKRKPKTRQLHHLAGIGALDGAFWGLLFGLLFLVPLFGMAVGAGVGAITGAFTDVGIDDKFIKEVRSQVTEGTSALFLLTSDVVMDRVLDAVHQQGLHPELIASSLSQADEDKLRAAFAAEE